MFIYCGCLFVYRDFFAGTRSAPKDGSGKSRDVTFLYSAYSGDLPAVIDSVNGVLPWM